MDMKARIVDDVYEGLRMTFLAVGKGRRPNPPQIETTKLLLVQLFFLRQEGDRPWREVEDWIAKLKPDASDVVQGRGRRLIEKAHAEYAEQSVEMVGTFLAQKVDLFEISPFLTELGINRKSFLFPKCLPNVDHVTNELIVEFDKAQKILQCKRSFILQWISCLLNCPANRQLQHWVEKTVKCYQKLLNNKTSKPNELKCFFETIFCLPTEDSTSDEIKKAVLPRSQSIKCSKCKELNDEIKFLREIITSLQQEKHDLILEIENKKQELESEKHRLELDLNQQKEKYIKSQQNIKRVKEFHSRQVAALNKENVTLREKSVQRGLKVRHMKRENKIIKKEVCSLTEQAHSKKEAISVPVKGDGKNAYSDEVTRTAISLVCEAGVSAANVKNVIEIVANNLFGYFFSDPLPCCQTVLNMVDAGYAISQFHAMDTILKCDNATLHSDGTSRDHKKIVGHQVSLSNGDVFYLGFAPVASENASTLLDLSLNVLRQLSSTYSDFTTIDTKQVINNVLSKVTSLMTDRAAAMKSYGRMFYDFLKTELGSQVQLHFLHCNAHYLLGLVSACEKAVASVEAEYVQENGALGRDKESKFFKFSNSKESATFRTIRMTSSVLGPNGDQKNGCRMEWITFCEKSFIPCFKSNRFNSHFEAAAAMVYHYSQMKLFFTSGILHDSPNLKIESVSADIQDDVLMNFICCLALIYLKVSGPYWKLVNSSVKYTEFHIYIKMFYNSLSKWSVDPSDLFDVLCTSAFENKMTISSPMSSAIHDFAVKCDKFLMSEIFRNICREALVVTDRQLADFYHEGYFSDMDAEAQTQLNHCPLTNLIGESAFGDFDFDVSKRRNSTLHNRTAVHCIKRNRTMQFLSKKHNLVARNLLKLARKRGRTLRKENNQLELKMKNDKKETFVLNQQIKIDREVKIIGLRNTLTKKVKEHGGPCNSIQELNVLLDEIKSLKKLRRTEILKHEVRFQKIVMGHKNLKLGTEKEMRERLRTVLSGEPLAKCRKHNEK